MTEIKENGTGVDRGAVFSPGIGLATGAGFFYISYSANTNDSGIRVERERFRGDRCKR